MKFKKGDEVLITKGKDRGKRGKIEKVFPKKGKVLVAGVNIYKKHLKKKDEKHPGGIIDIVKPLPTANIALLCPKCGKKTRIGHLIRKNEKQRICKKCKEEL